MANQLPRSPPHSLPHPHPHPQQIPYPSSSSSSSSSAPFRPKTSSDDLKYIQKYKDLKHKVKDIELDNDKLHIKVLKTKKNIQRLRIERAILYERLSAMPPSTADGSSQPLQRQQDIHPQPHPPYPLYSPDPQLHVARRQPDPQIPRDLPQAAFALDVHPPIHTDKERHPLDVPQRPYSGPDGHPQQPDPHFSHARPLSPVRLHHHPEPYPHVQQGHVPMDVDHPPPRTRRQQQQQQQQQTAQPHSGPSREGDRNAPLPVSLPPPPNTLGAPPPYTGVRHGANMTHSPHFDRDERVHAPPDAAYPYYPSPPTHRGRERDHERAQLNGPGLPPMRTHPDTHMQSPRAHSSPQHNGYAHPLPHPFSVPDDRHWERERERDHQPYPLRDRDRDREKDHRDVQHEPSVSNGYRDTAGAPPPPPRRYDAPSSHGNGSGQHSPSTPYLATRRSSLGHARTDSTSSNRGQEREVYDRRDREYPPYEYGRRPERDGADGGGGVYEPGRRRSLGENSEERAHETRGMQKSRRPSQDGVDQRRQVRSAGVEKEQQDMVPRVRDGELME